MIRDVRGMTLIEVLVALMLLSLLAAGMLTTFWLVQHTYGQLSAQDAARWEVMRSQQFLRGLLESAYPASTGKSHYALEGDSHQVAFTAPAPRGVNGRGYDRYEVALSIAPGGKTDWVVTSELDDTLAAGNPARDILLTGVQSVEWSYLEPPQETPAKPLETRWREQWQDAKHLPPLIRVRVTFPPGDARRWPELLIAPRLTDSARCVFDPVSQRCRESG